MAESSRLLAIDYGEKRIGLAISDALKIFAKPYDIIANTSYEDIVQQLIRIIQSNHVEKVIVGVPWSIEGEETNKTKETLTFIAKLKESLPVPVIGADERYTTSEANELLKQMGYDWKKARKHIDSIAACLILKGYLDNNENR